MNDVSQITSYLEKAGSGGGGKLHCNIVAEPVVCGRWQGECANKFTSSSSIHSDHNTTVYFPTVHLWYKHSIEVEEKWKVFWTVKVSAEIKLDGYYII